MIAPTPLRDVCSWEQHYNTLVNPTLMTGLLRKAIPVLDHCNWRVSEVRDGYCESVLPLNAASTNQHGTHQAALISLSADYTGGLALATLLRGIPLSGVHRCQDEESASLWLAAMNVKYKAPSSGHLTGVCEIDPGVAKNIQQRYARGSRVLVSLEIKFYSNSELVAVADMKYFAQPTISLSPTEARPARSTLFQHKLKASARMIAGVRAMGSDHPRLDPCCPYADAAAGPHGHLLAGKLRLGLPQLGDMVLARTQHIDEMLHQSHSARQVVMIGAGLDLRSVHHARLRRDITFFELDLPEMLDERSRVVADLGDSQSDRRMLIPADFRQDDIATLLANHPRFDPKSPTVFIYEGCSMYFSAAENQRIFGSVQSLMQHPDSAFWIDLVSADVANQRTNNESILSFLKSMEGMGERFVFGSNEPGEWLQQSGFATTQVQTCADYLGESDAVLSSYSFVVART